MNQEKLDNLRHSAAHLLAAAVMELWPDTKRTIGPSIANGFYYDFEFSQPISDADLPKIEKRMKKILTTWKEFSKSEISAADAKKEFSDNPYKLELIDEFAGEGQKLTCYKSGNFTDLCRGGHSEQPNKELKYFKLLSVAGAYWRGDEKNTMLTRIYGTAWPSQEELDDHLKILAEAKARDHRKLGRELDLFTFSELVGAGLPLWTPRGTVIRDELDKFIWELRHKYGYQKVTIPHITKKNLYEASGHWEKFSEELFRIKTRENHEFVMKPMNCPHHTQIFSHLPRSYRDMPQRYAETTMVYRDEQSGELSGLSRVRCITQDDAHVFCRSDQMEQEVLNIIDMIKTFYSAFGFNLKTRLSLHDPDNMNKYLGDAKVWQDMEAKMKTLLQKNRIKYEECAGEAAFYGPKIDFIANDSIGREWQVATVQIDFNMPERFKLTFVNKAGKDEQVVMIHAAIAGSIERFTAVLIEHLAGNFPLWLAPTQINILTVGESHVDFSCKLRDELASHDLRVEVDDCSETLGNKIRRNAKLRVPYTLVIGDKEMNSQDLAVRVRGQEKLLKISKEDFIKKIKKQIDKRQLELL